MRIRLIFPGLMLAAAFSVEQNAFAQQESRPEAVEKFSPQLDVGFAMHPRVGVFGITELMIAALEANLDEVKRLVEQGADLEETDDTGGTALMWAVQGGDLEIVDFLLERGADVRAAGGRNATALMIAVTSNKEDIAVRLLEEGATFAGELSYQKDYLEYAASNDQAALVRALIDHGADLEESGPDALCFAIQNRGFAAARTLVDAGVDVNEPGNRGNDLPMIHAVQSGNMTLVQMLVESGAELNRKDKAGRVSIMYYAAQTGLPSIISYLLDNGASVSRDEAQQLLRSAIYKGSMEMVDLFVSMGAEISAEHVFSALSRKHYEMASGLTSDMGVESIDDYTIDRLVDEAKKFGHESMVDQLLSVIDEREAQGELRLLFEMRNGDNCRLKIFDPGKREVTASISDGHACDAGLFTSRRDGSLFVVHGERIDVLSIDDAFSPYTLQVPRREIEARRLELGSQFAKQLGGGSLDWVTAEIVTVGYLGNGQVTVITHTGGPADGTYASQFAWDGSSWAQIDTQSCGRFDWICHIPGVDGRSIDRWPLRRAVWHTALQRNPGFVKWLIQNDDGGEDRPLSSVVFDFEGRHAELGYSISGSDHCDGVCIFTDSVTLHPDGAEPIRFILANSRVSIAGQFVLLRPMPQSLNTRLYDLVSGKDVLGDIARATWIH